MTAPLRPMNLGEILDQTFHIYRSRFLAFVMIATIPTLAMDLILFANEAWIHVSSLVHTNWTKSGLVSGTPWCGSVFPTYSTCSFSSSSRR